MEVVVHKTGLHSIQGNQLREAAKKNVFLGYLSQICLPYHPPQVFFVRFGKTKGEIWVEKGDFRGDLFFFRGLDLVWDSATPPTHIWERSPKKKVVFLDSFP